MKAVLSEPVLSIVIEPKTPADADRLERGIATLAKRDPSFRSSVNPDTGQTTLKGSDELHLDRLVCSLLDDFSVEARIGAPSVIYRQSEKQLLEPIMKITVVTPNKDLKVVTNDIRARRGTVLDQNTEGTSVQVSAFVPLANMFGFMNTLLSMTSGRATFVMYFDHYATCPYGRDPDDQPPFVQA